MYNTEFISHLSVLGVDDVELRQLELSLVAHSHGGVVPAVAHLGHWVGDYKTNEQKRHKPPLQTALGSH